MLVFIKQRTVIREPMLFTTVVQKIKKGTIGQTGCNRLSGTFFGSFMPAPTFGGGQAKKNKEKSQGLLKLIHKLPNPALMHKI